MGLDRHRAPDRPRVVSRRAQDALEAGARDLERVPGGDRVVLIERPRDGPSGPGDVVDVDPTLAIDRDPQDRTRLFEIEQVETLGGHHGFDECSHTG